MPYPTRTRTARDKRYDFRGTAKWKRTRLAVLKRDGYRCHWQGPACLGVGNQADHVVPVSHGGPLYDMDNLVASCGPCNRARPVAPVHSDSGVHRVVHVYASQGAVLSEHGRTLYVGSSRVDLQACKLEYSIVSPK